MFGQTTNEQSSFLPTTQADPRTPHATQTSNLPPLQEGSSPAVPSAGSFSEEHPRSPMFHRWYEMLEAPRTSRPPEVTFSEGDYTSAIYHKWFERHTGLSLDEAIALGLAARASEHIESSGREPTDDDAARKSGRGGPDEANVCAQ